MPSDANNKGNNNVGLGNRFGLGFASLRDRASEIGNNVASSVNEMNNKVTEKAANNASSPSNTKAVSTSTSSTSNTKAVSTPTSSSGSGGNSIATASKEELVEVLTKMNKKVKALSALRTQLQDKLQTTEKERDQFKSIVINSSVMNKRPTPLLVNDENGDGTNLGALSVEKLSKLWMEMETQDKQELLQLKRALSGQPQQQRLSNDNGNSGDGNGNGNDTDKGNDGDANASSLREEQLEQEHDRAMAALKDSMKQQYQQDLAQKDDIIARLQKSTNDKTGTSGVPNDTNSMTPSGEGSTSEREDDLKKRHTAEMEKLKKVAALQLVNFKKKVAAARSVELEKIKKETRAEVVKEFSNQQRQRKGEKNSCEKNETTTIEETEVKKNLEEDHCKKVQKLNDQQQQNIQQAKQEGQEEATKAAEAKIDKLQSKMKVQSSEHGLELQRVRKENSHKLERIIKEIEEKAASEESKAKSLCEQKLEVRIQELQKQHNTHLKSKQEEWQAGTQKKFELVKQGYVKSEKEREIIVNEKNIQEQKGQLDNLRSELIKQFETEKSKLQETSQRTLQEEQDELKQSTQRFVETLEAQRQELLQESQKTLETTVDKIKVELQRAHAEDIKKVEKENKAEQSNVVKALKDKFVAQAKQFQITSVQKEKEAAAEKQVEKLIRQEMTKELEDIHSKLQKEKVDHESSMERLQNETARKLDGRIKEASKHATKSLQQSAEKLKAAQDELTKLKSQSVEQLKKYEKRDAIERKQLKESHSLEVAKLRHDMDADTKKKIGEMTKRGISKGDSEVARIKVEFEKEMIRLKKETERTNEKDLVKVRAETTTALENAVSEANAEARQELSSSRKAFQIKIQSLEKEAQKVKGDHASSIQQEKDLQGQVKNLTSKLSALNDEKNAILTSTKDREKSSENAVKESLSKQRESYEKMMKDKCIRQDEKLQSLQTTIQELSVFREKYTELEKMKASIQEDFSSREKEKQDTIVLQKSKLDCLQKELTAIKSDFDDLSKDTPNVRKQLEDENVELSQKVEHLSTSLGDMTKKMGVELCETSKIVADLQEKLSKSEAKSSELVKSFEGKNTTLSNKIQTLNVNLDEAKKAKESHIASRDKTIAGLQKELIGSKMKQDELTKESLDDENQTKEKISTMLQQIKKLRADLEDSTKKGETEKSHSAKTISDLQQQIEQAQKLLISSKEDHGKTLVRITELTKTNIDSASAKVNELQQIVATKNSEIQGIQKTLAMTKESHHKSLEQLKSTEFNATQTSEMIRELQEVIEDKSKELEEMKRIQANAENDHRKSLEKFQQSIESGVSDTSQKVKELEQAIAAKENVLVDNKVKHDSQLGELVGKQSSLQQKNKNLENQLKQLSKNQDESSKQHDDALVALNTDLQKQHKCELDKIECERKSEKESLQSCTDLKMKEAEAKFKKELEEVSRKNSKDIDDLKKRMADHVDKMKDQLKTKLSEERENSQTFVKKAETKDKKREEQSARLAAQLKQMSEAIKKERNDKTSLNQIIKEQKSKKKKLEKELATAQTSLNETISNSESAAQSLLTEQDLLRKTSLSMESKVKKSQIELDQKANEVEELNGKFEALTQNINIMVEDIKNKDTALAEADKQKVRLFSSENEVAELRQQINKLKLEFTKNSQLANRLQSEKEASERNHGQRTAMMGMLESQLSEVNGKNANTNAKLEAALYDLSQKDEIVDSKEEKLKELQALLVKTQQEKRTALDNLARVEKGAAKKNSIQLENIQRNYQQLQQSSARKSSAAQNMIQEKEAECTSLRAGNKKLQQEVDKGSLSDRKIFELAAMQSNRDTTKVLDIEARDKALARLNHTLTERDGKLAVAEKRNSEYEAQIKELGRIRRREDVNTDYLKSIVVQFLSKAPGTSERNSLLPVLATLLQFDDNDYSMIEQGKSKISFWGSVEPVAIGTGATGNVTSSSSDYFSGFSSYLPGVPSPSPAPSSVRAPDSAEVNISAQNSTTSSFGRGTSLQF